MCILSLKSGPEHAERPSLLWFPKKVLPGLSAQWSVGTAPKPNIAGKYGTEQNNTAWCSSLWANTCHMHPQKSNINFTKQKLHTVCVAGGGNCEENEWVPCSKPKKLYACYSEAYIASPESGFGDAKYVLTQVALSPYFLSYYLATEYFPKKHSIFIQERNWMHSGADERVEAQRMLFLSCPALDFSTII